MITYLCLPHRVGAVCLLLMAGLGAVSAEDSRPPMPELPTRLSPLEGLIDPVTGEVFTTLDPVEQITPGEQRKDEALAHFMAGRVALERRDLEGATSSLRKSLELDPNSIRTYQTIIPLLLAQRETEEAKRYALQAARNTEEGYGLAVAIAGQLASRNDFAEGIELLQEVLDQGNYQPGTKEHLLLNRDLGLFYRLDNQITEAAEYYKIVLKTVQSGEVSEEIQSEIFKDPGKNFDEFGDTFLKADLPELALEAYEEASKYRDAKPGLHSFNLATVFQKTGKPEMALDALQEYFDAQLQGRGQAAYSLLESILKDLDREDELINRLEELFKDDEFNDSLRYFLADRRLEQGDIPRAKELYLGSSDEITDPRGMVGMLQIYREEGNSEKLLELLTKSFQVIPRPDDPEDLNRLAEDLRRLALAFEDQLSKLKEDNQAMNGLYEHARSLAAGDDPQLNFVQAYLLGKLATEAEQPDPAIEFYKLAIGMRNDPPFLLFSELGSYLIDAKRYKESIEILNEALTHPSNSLQSERWRLLYFLTYAYEFDGQTEEALKAVDEASNSAPDDFLGRLLYQKAWIFYHARNWEQALEHFNRVIEEYADDRDLVQDTQFRVSNIYVEMGDMEQGEQVLLDVLKDDPDNTQANNDLGYLWADQGKNLEKAHEMIKKALDQEPDNPAYLDSYGWVLFRQGDFDQAVEYLRKATEQKHGDDSTIFDHLGDALKKQGNSEEAIDNFKKALEIEQKKEHPSEKLLKALHEKL